MIGYVTLGTNDLARAARFYDALFGAMGCTRFMEEPGRYVAWAPSPEAPSVAVTVPFDGRPATSGNGTMVALTRANRGEVDAAYHQAIELGATCEGKPGPRLAGFYAAYFRDPDGNKLNVFCIEPV